MFRDLFCVYSQSGGGWGSGAGDIASVVTDGNFAYAGQLAVVRVPRGSHSRDGLGICWKTIRPPGDAERWPRVEKGCRAVGRMSPIEGVS
jgi:hypothetical protein